MQHPTRDRLPGLIERRYGNPCGCKAFEVMREQLTFMLAALVRLERRGDVVAHVEIPGAALHQLPVQEAGPPVGVEEQIADVGVAVDDAPRPGTFGVRGERAVGVDEALRVAHLVRHAFAVVALEVAADLRKPAALQRSRQARRQERCARPGLGLPRAAVQKRELLEAFGDLIGRVRAGGGEEDAAVGFHVFGDDDPVAGFEIHVGVVRAQCPDAERGFQIAVEVRLRNAGGAGQRSEGTEITLEAQGGLRPSGSGAAVVMRKRAFVDTRATTGPGSTSTTSMPGYRCESAAVSHCGDSPSSSVSGAAGLTSRPSWRGPSWEWRRLPPRAARPARRSRIARAGRRSGRPPHRSWRTRSDGRRRRRAG